MNAEWLDVLRKIKTGELSVEEGAKRLQELEAVQAPFEEPAAEVIEETPAATIAPASMPISNDMDDFHPDMGWWKDAWLILFLAGTVIFTLSALLMGWAYSAQRSFWFICAWLPMAFGLVVLFLGWWSRRARWVHVRVQDTDGSKVAISLPLPLRLTGWLLRIFGKYIPGLREQNLEALPDIFDSLAKAEGPVQVEVDDKGERVRVYII